jgi:hypothetical protein
MSGRQQRVMVQPIVRTVSVRVSRTDDLIPECYFQKSATGHVLQFLCRAHR